MGASQNKDPTIRIYITLSKRIYYAGETVQGVVHIDCLANRPYNQLFIRLHGSQNVHWQESYGKGQVHYSNYKDTYNEEFLLTQFPMGIKTGQYSYPFSLLLPAAFPGSFEQAEDNWIRYSISAFFPNYDQNSSVQIYEKPLHLREPPRTVEKGFKMQIISEAKCWSCCCVCGSANLSFQADSIGLMHNQTFHASGLVDNSRGSTRIKSFKVVLRECIKQVSEWEYIRVRNPNQFVLYQCPNEVPIGTSLPFSVEIKVPIEVLGHSGIGNIIYRAYFLELVASVNCCYSNPKASKHIILNTSIQPPIDEDQLKQAPENWRPIVAPPVSFLNLKPYLYAPNANIDVSNQTGPINPMMSMNQESINSLIL